MSEQAQPQPDKSTGDSLRQLYPGAKQSGSDRAKRTEKIIEGKVTRQKKPLGRQLREFFSAESLGMAAQWVLQETLVPAFKEMIVEGWENLGRMWIQGPSETRRRRTYYPGRDRDRGGYYDYSAQSRRWDRDEPPIRGRVTGRSPHNFDEIVLETRGDAEEVIEQLYEMLSKYDSVTVRDLYDMVGVTGSYTDEKYGWTDLHGVRAVRIRGGGYVLDIPRPVPLD